MPVRRITKSLVDRLKSGCTAWDDDCRGFGVRRQVRDASYILKVRIHGRQRFLTIGKHGAPWTPETARTRARRLLGEIAEGKDPATVRDAQRAVPNFKEFSDRYLTEHAVPRKKPRGNCAHSGGGAAWRVHSLDPGLFGFINEALDRDRSPLRAD